jgi:hypothetical protein
MSATTVLISSGPSSGPSPAQRFFNGKIWNIQLYGNGLTQAQCEQLTTDGVPVVNPVLHLPLADGSTANPGVRDVTNAVSGTTYAIVNGADSCWAATQDVYHSNMLNGFSWSGVAGQPFVPPSLSDPTVDAIAGLPLTNPAGAWHNDAESTINFCANPAAPVFFGKDVPGDGVLANYSFDGDSGDVVIGMNQITKEGRFTLLR